MEIEPAPLVRGPTAALERPGLHNISPVSPQNQATNHLAGAGRSRRAVPSSVVSAK
jgi:hypothetical protein